MTADSGEASVLMRIYIGEDDRYGGQPLFEAIVLKAREMKLAGATVLRGPMGFGASSRIHTEKLLRLSEDLPIVIEIVDSEVILETFLAEVESMMQGGLITMESVRVRHYQSGRVR